MSSETRSSDTIRGSSSTTEKIRQGLGSGSNNGFINSGRDHDWFRISLREGEQYQFQALGSSLSDPILTLRNSSGDRLAQNNDGGAGLNALINFMAKSTGTYYLDVWGSGGSKGSYSVLASEGTLDVKTDLSGKIQGSGDHDWYAIDLEAGEQYVFQMRGSPSGGGKLSDSLLTLRNSTGAVVTRDDDSGMGSDAFIQFTARTSGTYYLDAGASGGATGTYDLTARSFSDDLQVYQSTYTRGSMDIVGPGADGDASQAGIISDGPDHDWFRITLRAGEQYKFQATAPNYGEGGMVLDPRFSVRNSAGDRGNDYLAFNNDYGGTTNSRIFYTATYTGTYYLDVGGVREIPGAYVVRAREVPGNASTYAKLAVDAMRTGDIHSARDHDWVAIKLKAGEGYSFQMRGSATDDGTLADTFLFLRNSSGKVVARDDDSGVGANSLINFTAKKGGTYYLDASADGDHTGSYELSFDLGFAPTAHNDLLV